jgi:myo-inositol-1(or 4)-monophosphatase
MQEWLDAAQAALDAAGAAIRPYFRNQPDSEQKDDDSPVTVADRAAEVAIRDVLAGWFPDHGLLGEEFPAGGAATARHVWVIDPIDGTRAFITGRPSFCTLLALLEDGVPVLGCIDQPVTGERWIGGRDLPASFRGGLGGKIGPRRVTTLAAAELSATTPDMFGANLPRFERLKAQCRRVYWGGDAYAYGLLVLGQIDIVAECGMKPWDWAALVPVVRAAGGVITDWAGGPLRLGGDGSVLAAANPALHAAAIAAL